MDDVDIKEKDVDMNEIRRICSCLLYTSPSPRD